MIRVTVWGENYHDRLNARCKEIYPHGMHNAIADGLRTDDIAVRVALFDEPEHGLTQEVLDETDVLIWWGHSLHGQVDDAVVNRAFWRVNAGMGFIALHSSHCCKLFCRLIGTSGALQWRVDGEKERLWVVDPGHPIAEGLDQYFELEEEEMYGEHFDIPKPDDLVMISWFEGGEVFRSGCTFHRGLGKIFYFRPGHETFPTYYDRNVRRVISNAVRWAVQTSKPKLYHWNQAEPLEPIKARKDGDR